MKYLKIIGFLFLLIIFGIILFLLNVGIMRSPEGYNQTEEEYKFKENFNKQTRLKFYYTNRHHDSTYQNIDIYDRNDSIARVAFLNKSNIKKFSDSTFYEFMKVYNQKSDVDTLKMKFHLSKIDTVFLYKVSK